MSKGKNSNSVDAKSGLSLDEFELDLSKVAVVEDVEEEEEGGVEDEDETSAQLIAPTTASVLPTVSQKIEKAKKPKKKLDVEIVPGGNEDRFKRLLTSQTVTNLVKQYGKLAVVSAAQLDLIKPPVLPFGIFPLDYAVGGGVPWGHVVALFGPQHGGKTTIATKLLVQAQNTCVSCYSQISKVTGTCALDCGKMNMAVCCVVDVEGTFNLDWTRTLGGDLSRLLLSKPSVGEESVDIIEALLRSGDVDFLVLDSIAFMTPEKTLENASGVSDMGVQSRMLNQGFRKFRAAIAERAKHDHFPILVFTNHIYQAVGVIFGSPERVQGGNKLRYITSVEIRLQGKVKEDTDTEDVMHIQIDFKVEKNKWAPRAKKGELTMLLANVGNHKVGETFDEPYIRQQAEHHGLMKKGIGGKYWLLDQGFATYKEMDYALAIDHEYRARVVAKLIEEGGKLHLL